MPTRLVQETRHAAGHASLIVADAALLGKDPSALSLMIVKSGGIDSFLDPDRSDGWAPIATSFRPNAASATAQGAVFDVDDSVTYSLRTNTSYRLRVLEGGAQVVEQGFAMPATFRRRSSPPTRWMATPQTVDQRSGIGASAVGASTISEASVSAASIDQHSRVPSSDSAAPPKPAELLRRGWLWPVFLGVVALLVAVGLAFWSFSDRKPPIVDGGSSAPPKVSTQSEVPVPTPRTQLPPSSPTPSDPPPAIEKPGIEPALPSSQPDPVPAQPGLPQGPTARAPTPAPQGGSPSPTPLPAPSPQSGQVQDLSACRSMLQSSPSVAAARDLALQLSQGSQLPDCQFLLARFAANQGDAASARMMGTMYDPATWSAATSPLPSPNPREAERWYRMAAEAGDVDAQYRYAMLLRAGHLGAERRAESARWLEKAASAGNEAAKRELAK